MKTATAEVVPPNTCKEVDTGEGSSTPTTDIKIPTTIDKINGFLESLAATCLAPSHADASPSLYNSSTMMEVAIATIPMEAAANVAKCSLCSELKAKVMKGIPKKARLPKTVLKTSR